LVYANGEYHEATFLPEKMVGRSGRGDTCIASYMAKRLTSTPEDAIIWSAAVTSLKMEAEGPIQRSIKDVETLIHKKYS
jgi:sugar/nucleoside kinase (ribokinase family)